MSFHTQQTLTWLVGVLMMGNSMKKLKWSKDTTRCGKVVTSGDFMLIYTGDGWNLKHSAVMVGFYCTLATGKNAANKLNEKSGAGPENSRRN